ncbi:MAG: hypothetical protein OQK05_05540 [Pseudopelagicola sp.]|nr:hypothetical protein [Pseudopelagicola sp.]
MRILVASYLMAASVGIAPGPDLVPILEQFMPRTSATVLGTAVLFLLAYAMMAGMWLRITILLLAIILVGTSYMENFILAATPDLGTMWQEVVVLCALMQNLIHLTNRQLRKSAIVRRKKPVRRIEAGDPLVRLRPDDLPQQVQGLPLSTPPKQKPVKADKRHDDEIANIFA